MPSWVRLPSRCRLWTKHRWPKAELCFELCLVSHRVWCFTLEHGQREFSRNVVRRPLQNMLLQSSLAKHNAKPCKKRPGLTTEQITRPRVAGLLTPYNNTTTGLPVLLAILAPEKSSNRTRIPSTSPHPRTAALTLPCHFCVTSVLPHFANVSLARVALSVAIPPQFDQSDHQTWVDSCDRWSSHPLNLSSTPDLIPFKDPVPRF